MYHVYVLISLKDRKLYIGFTTDIKRRMDEHARGHVPSTSARRPVRMIYYETYLSEKEAKRRERYLKGGKGRKDLKTQLEFTLAKFQYRFL